MTKKPLQTFPVSSGLLEPQHVQAIGAAVWVYLWFLNRVTRDEERGDDFLGVVLHGRSVSIRQIAEELGIKERACRRYLARLVKAGYVLQKKTGVGTCIYAVTKSKRWAWKRRPSKAQDPARSSVEPQASFWSEAPDSPDQKVVLGAASTDQILVKPDQKQASAKNGSRARLQETTKTLTQASEPFNSTSVAQILCSVNGWSGTGMIWALTAAIDFQSKHSGSIDLAVVGESLVKSYFEYRDAKGTYAFGPQKFFEQGLYRPQNRAERAIDVFTNNPATRALAQMAGGR